MDGWIDRQSYGKQMDTRNLFHMTNETPPTKTTTTEASAVITVKSLPPPPPPADAIQLDIVAQLVGHLQVYLHSHWDKPFR